MIKKPGKEIACVVVFTGYMDGTVDFTQDAPRKTPEGFAAVKECFKGMIRQLRTNLRDEAKCPFSPNNPQEYVYDENGKPAFLTAIER